MEFCVLTSVVAVCKLNSLKTTVKKEISLPPLPKVPVHWHHYPNQIGALQLMSSNISSNSGSENDKKSFGFTTLEKVEPLSSS